MASSVEQPAARDDVDEIELELLLEGVYRRYGFDFRQYAPASLRRRVWRRVHAEGLTTLSALQDKLLHDPACMERLLLDLSINVTAMFRDPSFYIAFREKVVPLLRTYPFTRIWVAGCSTGEEVYSLAILLRGGGHRRASAALRDGHQRVGARPRPGRRLPARQDARVHAELHQGGRAAGFLGVLRREVRRSAVPALARRQRRLRAAQPRLGSLVQRVQRDRVPQRDDLLRPRAAGPRAPPLLREPDDVRSARARCEGVASGSVRSRIATRTSTRTSACTRRSPRCTS